jgi:hypothetical protein
MSSASSRAGSNRSRSSCWRRPGTATRPCSAPASFLSSGFGHLTRRHRRACWSRAPILSRRLSAAGFREAAGNPLALVELPSIARRLEDEHSMPGLVPLTERMERAFAARAADLPPEAQLLLLVAALNDSESLGEVLQAGAELAGGPVDVALLQAAADVAIIELGERILRFRHPLMRSAVSQAAPIERRRRAHEALAEVLSGQPDRSVWHRAALISGSIGNPVICRRATSAQRGRDHHAGPDHPVLTGRGPACLKQPRARMAFSVVRMRSRGGGSRIGGGSRRSPRVPSHRAGRSGGRRS